MRAVNVGLVVGGLLLAASSADAQSIHPRVMVMIDTSGSMTEHVNNNVDSGADGSSLYKDPNMSKNYLYRGNTLNGSCTAPDVFDGVNSRLYAAKAAMTNVVNGSGDIDWGLMKYVGESTFNTTSLTTWVDGYCPLVNTVTTNTTSCTSDDQCGTSAFCNTGTGKCFTDNNLCISRGTFAYTVTTPRGGACNTYTFPGTYLGTGCSAGTTGGVGTACATPITCTSDADCGGVAGSCKVPATLPPGVGGGVKICTCATGATTCPTNYTCDTTNKECVYSAGCFAAGGSILFNPATTSNPAGLLKWVDGIEDYTNASGVPTNPELRAVGNTPLAGAARTATSWYNSAITSDTVKACRPYVLVQITDGFDTCEGSGAGGSTTAGPVAAAQAFVAATVSGNSAKPLNKVYVIGLNLSSPTLDAIAAAGGTGAARLATSQQDIEAALADIVSSSVLHEICNDDDDNCNGLCDEDFPDVAVDKTVNPVCTPRPAKSCDNGALGLCHASGKFACSTDKLSEVCVVPTCTATPGASISAGAGAGREMRLTNVSGMSAANLGQFVFVSGSARVANNGGFLISGINSATSIDVANPGVVLPDASSVSWGIPSTQGKGTTAVGGGNVTITITTGSTNGLVVGDAIFVAGGVSAGNNGQFTISAIDTANNKITFANANGVGGDNVVWAVDICKGVETCNGLDDDCDGVIDNCGGGGPGSCCTSNCPACAKAPFIETCNNCDDDCDGVIDNHLVDTGLSCGNNVGDCAGGVTMCCSSDPNTTSCTINGTSDKIWCKSGNAGYPVTGPDKCDGTDDNCNGVSNDEPPLACFTDGVNTLPPMKDGVGVCHHGIEQCLTLPLCGTSGLAPPNCIVGSCPVGWPAGKTCPNPTPVYGSCQGLVAPSTEFCDGLDNDCDACIDNNPQDTWLNTECCSTGNLADCDNTLTGTRCHRGHWQCVQPGGACTAGSKQCVGSVAKSPETCNMIDDDCNGTVDDVPGVGAPCTGTGIYTGGECKAVMQCVAGNAAPQCVQTVGPVMETCNGKDDNCNGLIDDNGPPLAVNPLPGVGVACDVPIPPMDKPPCKAGTTVCVAGMIQCQGAVGPMPNQCNGISTDCTGNPNTNGNCPTGFQCYQGNCVAPCQAGEFPCPGGYACNMNTTACDVNGVHNGCCVPDACAQITCPIGFNCQLDAQGNATCIDPCVGVTCPASYICKLGACVDGSCRTQGCPDGQICVNDPNTNMFGCQPDPCANVMCDGSQFCQAGVCVNACAGPCPNGQYCNKGQCVPDPCAHTPCVEGQVCRVENGIGVCVENQCQFGCNIGQACCGGECVADQCENLHCPEDTHCTLTPDCQATCETNPASPKDQIVGAGGGGFGCAVAGHSTGETSSSLVWLLAVAGLLLFRRRRTAEVRK